MLKTIRFFKIAEGPQSGWYADVPNHTLEENQMVSRRAWGAPSINLYS